MSDERYNDYSENPVETDTGRNDESYMEMLRDEEYSSEERSSISWRGILACVVELGYLLFALIAGCVFLAESDGRPAAFLFAALSFAVGIGDAFYLIPKVRQTIEGPGERITDLMIRGISVSSGMLTVLHIFLYYIWRVLYSEIASGMAVLPLCVIILWGAAAYRAGAGLLSLGNRYGRKYDRRWILHRTLPVVVTGVMLIILFLLPLGGGRGSMWHMSLAVLVVTGCSIPLSVWYEEVPAVGLLMIPRAAACAAMLIMGLLVLV